jgi:ribulose-phosphate 3-epimerase
MKHLIAPSILAADFGKIYSEVEMLNASQADWVHVDVMDGSFVPNISFGFPVIKAIKSASKLPLDVHLMIDKPERYLQQFKDVGADVLTVHAEACVHLHRTIQQIKELGMKAGVALNPHTNVDTIADIIEDVDLVCLMSVNPGFGGQKFIYNTVPKTKKLRQMIDTRNASAMIEIDGGVGLQNAEKLLQAGANVLVAGSAVFKADDPHDTIVRLKSIGKDTFMV